MCIPMSCFLDISDFLIFFKLKVLISMWLGHLPGTLLILSKNIFVTSHQVDFFFKGSRIIPNYVKVLVDIPACSLSVPQQFAKITKGSVFGGLLKIFLAKQVEV